MTAKRKTMAGRSKENLESATREEGGGASWGVWENGKV